MGLGKRILLLLLIGKNPSTRSANGKASREEASRAGGNKEEVGKVEVSKDEASKAGGSREEIITTTTG